MALAAEAAGVDARSLRYLPYDGGGKAMLALLGGEIAVLCTGLGETAGYVASGDVRVLAVAAPERSGLLPDAPTLTELGAPVVFANWRGLFAAPGTPAELALGEQAQIRAARQRPEWQRSLERYGWADLDLEGDAFQSFLAAQESELKRVLTGLGFIR
jgi:putative tricarboxylic transport membrane protein